MSLYTIGYVIIAQSGMKPLKNSAKLKVYGFNHQSLCSFINIFLILLFSYEQILLEPDPGPSYALKLLLALLEQNSHFIKDISRQGLVPVIFQVLMVGTCIMILFFQD